MNKRSGRERDKSGGQRMGCISWKGSARCGL